MQLARKRPESYDGTPEPFLTLPGSCGAPLALDRHAELLAG